MADSFDFPAAHSMDTRWFAIDRDGHVALMESGEGGAVPLAWKHDEGAGYELTERLAEALAGPAGGTVPVEGVHAAGPHGTFIMRGDFSAMAPFASNVQRRPDGMLVVLFGVVPPRTGFSIRRLFGGTPKPESLQPLFERAHEVGACKGCCEDDTPDLGFDAEELVERFGLFYFDGPAGIAEPYERVFTPATPLSAERIAELAPLFVKFDGCFAEREKLQPFEHWKDVASWSASWVGTDGKVRCAPGREKDYAEEYPDLATEYTDVEPPKK